MCICWVVSAYAWIVREYAWVGLSTFSWVGLGYAACSSSYIVSVMVTQFKYGAGDGV